jgi:putative aldouronate transport system substrate-binding protein
MKMTKITLASLLCSLLLTALLMGCSGKTDGGAVKADTVTFFMLTFNSIPDDYSQIEDAINKHIASVYPDANVRLRLQLFGPAEYEEKIRLAMQSGSPIELFTPLNFQGYVSQNQILPLEELLKTHGKPVTDIVYQDIGEDAFKTFELNGHIYGVPINKGMVVTPTLIYNKDMLNAAGFSINDINNIHDLEPVFDKIKALYPDVFPYVGTNAGDTYMIPLLAGENDVDVLSDRVNYMGVIFGNSGKVVNLYETPQFAEYTGLMRSWYNKGYMPKDLAVSSSMAMEYFGAARAFCTMAGYGGNAIGVTISSSIGRNMGNKWIAPYYFDSSTASLATAIASTTKIPEAAMKMINIIYTDEFVINTMLYGIEGVDYTKVDGHHWAYPEGKNENMVSYTAAYSTGVVGSERLQLQPAGMDYDDVLLKLRQNKENKRSPYFGFVFDASGVRNELTALSNVYSQYIPGLVCGSSDPTAAIPELNRALKAAGIDAVVAEKQKQLDAWIAANK